jgi:hypothetical protein
MMVIIFKQLKELVVLAHITVSSRDSLFGLFPTFPQGVNMYSGTQFVTLVNLQ